MRLPTADFGFAIAARVSIALCAAACFGSGVAANAAGQPPTPSPTLVDRFLAPESSPLVSYRGFRRLTASTRGGRMEAAIDVSTSLDDRGFTYQITSEEGSGLIRNRVLLAALEAERKAAKGPDADRVALTPANYEFLGVSAEDDNLLRIGIKPRRKHAMLLNGMLFLAADTADLVRIEGEPSERPSFWTRHVRIVREYARVGGVRVPVSMRSTADVLIAGSSTFWMTYRYTEINGLRLD